jgi:hypothetical protein
MSAVAYAGGTSTGSSTSQGAGSNASATSTSTQAETTPQLLAAQLTFWDEFGGNDLLNQYSDALGALTKAEHAGSIDVSAMRRACSALIAAATRAEAYFPLPDGQEPLWSADLTNTIRGGQACLNGLAHSNDQLLLSGIARLDSTSGSINGITAQMLDESRP